MNIWWVDINTWVQITKKHNLLTRVKLLARCICTQNPNSPSCVCWGWKTDWNFCHTLYICVAGVSHGRGGCGFVTDRASQMTYNGKGRGTMRLMMKAKARVSVWKRLGLSDIFCCQYISALSKFTTNYIAVLQWHQG